MPCFNFLNLIFKTSKGRRQKKKLVLLGGASCGEGTNFICRKIFLGLESPETEKNLSDLKVKFLPPFDNNL